MERGTLVALTVHHTRRHPLAVLLHEVHGKGSESVQVFPLMNVTGMSKASGLTSAVGAERFSLIAQPFRWLLVPRLWTPLSAIAARLIRHVREPLMPSMSEEWLRHSDRESARQIDH